MIADMFCSKATHGDWRARKNDASQATVNGRTLVSRHLAHQCEQVLFGIAEESHPEIVVWHFGDDVRLVFENDRTIGHLPIRGVNVGNAEIKYRTGMVELGFFSHV